MGSASPWPVIKPEADGKATYCMQRRLLLRSLWIRKYSSAVWAGSITNNSLDDCGSLWANERTTMQSNVGTNGLKNERLKGYYHEGWSSHEKSSCLLSLYFLLAVVFCLHRRGVFLAFTPFFTWPQTILTCGVEYKNHTRATVVECKYSPLLKPCLTP